jgi:hypothetical protein
MFLILVGKLVLFQTLNELVDFFSVVPLTPALPQSACVDRFRGHNTYLGSILGL